MLGRSTKGSFFAALLAVTVARVAGATGRLRDGKAWTEGVVQAGQAGRQVRRAVRLQAVAVIARRRTFLNVQGGAAKRQADGLALFSGRCPRVFVAVVGGVFRLAVSRPLGDSWGRSGFRPAPPSWGGVLRRLAPRPARRVWVPWWHPPPKG